MFMLSKLPNGRRSAASASAAAVVFTLGPIKTVAAFLINLIHNQRRWLGAALASASDVTRAIVSSNALFGVNA